MYPTPYAALKEALALSDAQVQQLMEVQRSRQTANQAVYQQIAARQKQLTETMNSGNPDAFTVGQLEIDLANLRKQVASTAALHDQALAVLDSAQRAKLADLQNALKLQPAAQQAVGMGLIQPPSQTQFSDDIGN